MKHLAALFLVTLFYSYAGARDKYWITFTDKNNVTFDPRGYFEERTIDQRTLKHISLCDSTDFPVSPAYLAAVESIADAISWSSRWLNGVSVFARPAQVVLLKQLSFVQSVVPMVAIESTCAKSNSADAAHRLNENDKKLLRYQTARLQGDSFLVHGLDGTGIRIAVFDAGFPGVDVHPAFAHLRDGGKIVATYDFVRRTENVYKHHWHGTATLSCLAGRVDSINIGLATGAEFLLARTERATGEPLSEEENWLAAAEWADKHGANIISSSLGYTEKRYFNYQMDGRSSLIAKAASIAASKGILVVNSAGNEGNNDWYYLVTPADADSVLAVGGTDPEKDMHILFSSFGPSSDGRLKPNVSAPGTVIAARKHGLANVYGTSFSAPLIAGFAACAWQSHRAWNNMELFHAIEKSAHLYPYFDYAHGFGIPQAGWFTRKKETPEPTFDFVIINDEIKVVLREQFSYSDTEAALGYNVRRNFYYKVEDKSGAIRKYYVLLAEKKEMLHFFAGDFKEGDVLTVHFEGYTGTLDFPENK